MVTVVLILVLDTGCTSYSDYSTDPGECYSGEIIDAEFIRSPAFGTEVEMIMSLDADALGRGDEGAWITTDDGLFLDAGAEQPDVISRDSISMLDFPGGRIRSYLTFTQASDGLMAMAVISLMEDENVEVRIIRPDRDTDSSLFGVFRLVRTDNCTISQDVP